jgi:4-cresol dehydrogenase (hydroxylating)
VLSLQRMAALDLHGASARLQPGVTFGALATRLRSDAPQLLPPEIGSGPDASVLGNALAGGLGKGPYGWMARRLSDVKMALPDGNTLRLESLARSGLADSGSLARKGVVLEAKFRLCEMPAFRAVAWARLRDGQGACADALEVALLAASERGAGEQAELLNGARLKLQSPAFPAGSGEGIHAGWLLALTLWGQNEDEIAWRQARARQRLARLSSVATGVEAIERVADLPSPDRQGLTSAYTLTGRLPPPDADPDRDGCGVRWFGVLLPSTCTAAVATLDMLGSCAIAHGFAPAIAVRLPDGDPVALLGLFWNRNGPVAEVVQHDARAAACATVLRDEAERLGLVLYRRGAGEAPAKTLLGAL